MFIGGLTGVKMELIKTSVMVAGKEISIESGKLAKQANGACVVRMGDTMVLVTAVASSIHFISSSNTAFSSKSKMILSIFLISYLSFTSKNLHRKYSQYDF